MSNGIPALLARELGATHVISVHLPAPPCGRPPADVFQVIRRCFQIMQTRTEDGWRQASDLVITPDLRDIAWDGFECGPELVNAGEAAASAVLPKIESWFSEVPCQCSEGRAPKSFDTLSPSSPHHLSPLARVSTDILSCRGVGSRPVLGPRFGRIKPRTFDPFGFRCRDEPPLPRYDWAFGGVRLTHSEAELIAARDIRAIRALPRVDKFCCPVLIAIPARDPFASPREAARTGLGEQKQVLFSCTRGRYASVTLTNASDADERSRLSRCQSEAQQDDESHDEFNPPDTVACHVLRCALGGGARGSCVTAALVVLCANRL